MALPENDDTASPIGSFNSQSELVQDQCAGVSNMIDSKCNSKSRFHMYLKKQLSKKVKEVPLKRCC